MGKAGIGQHVPQPVIVSDGDGTEVRQGCGGIPEPFHKAAGRRRRLLTADDEHGGGALRIERGCPAQRIGLTQGAGHAVQGFGNAVPGSHIGSHDHDDGTRSRGNRAVAFVFHRVEMQGEGDGSSLRAAFRLEEAPVGVEHIRV